MSNKWMLLPNGDLARLREVFIREVKAKGEVKFVDSAPKLAPVKVTKDQDYCGETLPNESYLIDANGGFKNVVVFLEAVPATVAPDPQRLNMIENTGCRYVPRVLAMQKGERLRVKNNDPKLHIPHSYLNDKTVFMLSLPFRNSILDATQKIRDAGILKLVCDTHAWMLGFVHVFDHPFFAVTDEKGAFSIPNIPAGTYTLKAWHEDAGMRSQEVVVSESGDSRVNFEFGSTTFSSLPCSRVKHHTEVKAGALRRFPESGYFMKTTSFSHTPNVSPPRESTLGAWNHKVQSLENSFFGAMRFQLQPVLSLNPIPLSIHQTSGFVSR